MDLEQGLSQPTNSFPNPAKLPSITSGLPAIDDGRIHIDLRRVSSKTLARVVGTNPDYKPSGTLGSPPPYSPSPRKVIPLNIVIQVVGSRGDVQPFVALGNELQKHGHRVRIATHNVFKKFITDSYLEFYPIGGDPADLMAYMVKNPGLIPSMDSVRAGDIQKKRKMIAELLNGCWLSCIEPDPDSGRPFVASSIIANPPSFAHVHCAQALGIPLHLMFTMPWTSTASFPHPLASITADGLGVSQGQLNNMSYSVFEWMTWQGLGDVINEWRSSMLDLEPITISSGPKLADSLQVPFTYCWSPALVPKPNDWPSYIDVCGFFFREPPPFEPSLDLEEFLARGSEPVYIGFGSIVIDDPERLTNILVNAVRKSGTRAIISRGWYNLGSGIQLEDENILFLGDCPHEWLFQKVSAVVHHGGAGTTACGLRNGVPTLIVPFFGDQPFWGEMVARAGAGPPPIGHKSLDATNLAEAITFCLQEDTKSAAKQLAAKMSHEAGVPAAADSFHRHFPFEHASCNLLPNQPAAWTYKRGKTKLKLSKLAAEILIDHLKIDGRRLQLFRPKPVYIDTDRWDPVTAALSSSLTVGTEMLTAAVDIVRKPVKAYKTESTSNRSDKTDDLVLAKTLNSTKEPQVMKQDRSCLGSSRVVMGSATTATGVFVTSIIRGSYVNVPLAITEGLRAVPKLYGEDVPDHEPITGWKSGTRVAGHQFALGLAYGVCDIFVQPYLGARKEGGLGAVKGLGKGFVGTVTKIGSGALGLFAYPAQGIYRSIRTRRRNSAVGAIQAAMLAEGKHELAKWRCDATTGIEESLLERFASICANQQ
ncbi:uncharacterized protein CTRU02_210744 [Colletotrichum truncatum]|uniref:Uncharacterized protein n=1 Tax=Colletotrichum truncatum TaxID=5467 RepID=A0ACC3YPW9_COLTU|nr:uncharacterized protein CTRU02_03769 [Colletotrichum truncatum]KAF6796791.1 hypothetical protein CTRU02_03769 [Colletotrichum truncatum]